MTESNDESAQPTGEPVDGRAGSADDGRAESVDRQEGEADGRAAAPGDRSEPDQAQAQDDGVEDVAPLLSRRRQLTVVGVVAVLTVVLDQLTKWWALETLTNRAPIELVGSLQFNLAFNEGAAFSFGDGWNLGPFIAVLALVVVAFLIRSPAAMTSGFGAATAGLIAGGAIGNLVDRAFRSSDGFFGGAVVDFIDLQWYPVFNIADSAVCVGAVLFVIVGWRQPAAGS
jgi:signal peptidase II